MTTTCAAPGPWVEQWLSTPRFQTYLGETGGDRQRALDLYEWNTAMAAAVLHDLAHVEVAVRNAYDGALVARQPGPAHWTSDELRYFPVRWQTANNGRRYDENATPREQIASARRSAGVGAPPGKVVAELMFSFWRYLSIAAREVPLWRPYLHHGFLPGTSRVAVDRPMSRLHRLRNRVAPPRAAAASEPFRPSPRRRRPAGMHLARTATTCRRALDLGRCRVPATVTHQHRSSATAPRSIGMRRTFDHGDTVWAIQRTVEQPEPQRVRLARSGHPLPAAAQQTLFLLFREPVIERLF